MNAINDIAKKYKMPVIYSTHPRSWKKIEESKFELNPLVKQLKPFGFFSIIMHCKKMHLLCYQIVGTLSRVVYFEVPWCPYSNFHRKTGSTR